MSDVQRYAVNCNDAWPLCADDPTEGTYVKYEKYEEIKDKLGELISIIEHTSNDYCMCGCSIESHLFGGCGNPTGAFDYHYANWRKKNVEFADE